jgi:hypothetical protein
VPAQVLVAKQMQGRHVALRDPLFLLAVLLGLGAGLGDLLVLLNGSAADADRPHDRVAVHDGDAASKGDQLTALPAARP